MNASADGGQDEFGNGDEDPSSALVADPEDFFAIYRIYENYNYPVILQAVRQ